MSTTEQRPTGADQEPLGKFARLGMALADWSQKWFPGRVCIRAGGHSRGFRRGPPRGRGAARLVDISATVSGA